MRFDVLFYRLPNGTSPALELLIVVTGGFIKKTNKAPTAEIEKAIKAKRDFEGRM